MNRPGRDETQMLYGRPKVPRSHHRIMLGLLAADGIDVWDLARLAQVPVYVAGWVLVRLQTLGWAEIIPDPLPDNKRIRYRLTGRGGAAVRRLLGLDPNTWPKAAEKGSTP